MGGSRIGGCSSFPQLSNSASPPAKPGDYPFIYENLRFLIFDELHTYRGRQGADIALLMRRIRSCCAQEVVCIGTSATMVSVGTLTAQRAEVANVATKLFGKPFAPEQVIPEYLDRSLSFNDTLPTGAELAA